MLPSVTRLEEKMSVYAYGSSTGLSAFTKVLEGLQT